MPSVPHQLCQFHYLREAARPIYEADRHAKKELKKRVRGIRPLERVVESREDEEAAVIRDYCSAVRIAITDDGRPPLEASGLKLHGRLTAITESLTQVAKKRATDPVNATKTALAGRSVGYSFAVACDSRQLWVGPSGCALIGQP